MFKRVVVTGLGIISPIGNNINDYWKNLISGKNGVNYITYFNTKNLKTKFACEVKNYNFKKYFSKRYKNRIDLMTQYGLIATNEAIIDSNLNLKCINRNKVHIIWGTGIGGITNIENDITNLLLKKKIKLSPFFVPKIMADTTPNIISIKYKIYGPSYTTVSSCTSSATAIINGYNSIKYGLANIVITGGSEACITRLSIIGFNSLNALSKKNNDINIASRPFDKDRDGFIIGEGSGVIILEELNHAIKRKAKIYCEIIGVGSFSDGFHITKPDIKNNGMKKSIICSLNEANISSEKINYINAHGASTKIGDKHEIKVFNKLFKKNKNLYVSSIKSMIGHLLGASGAVEAISTILTIKNKIIPPTINSINIENIKNNNFILITNKNKYVPNIKIAMSNNFGFGGHNTCIIFSKFNI